MRGIKGFFLKGQLDMKKITSLLGITSVLLLVAVCPAFGSIFANPQVGESVVFYTMGGGNGGGPFEGHLGSGTVWNTFCVEADGALEWFVPGATYNVLNTKVSTATSTGNTVTAEAKWLYWMYGTNWNAITGQIGSTTYTYNNDVASKTSLQEAIWHGVNRLIGGTLTDPPDAEPYDTVAQLWYDTAHDAIINGDTGMLDYVYVVNPGYYGTSQSQSMLYACIPEPASFIIWSLIAGGSMLGVLVLRRREGQVGAA
jgi:hypothetical protein